MLGARTSQVFTSRWKALFWAAGVMLTAYCTIPGADDVQDKAKPGEVTDAAGLTQQQHDDADAAIRALRDLGSRN